MEKKMEAVIEKRNTESETIYMQNRQKEICRGKEKRISIKSLVSDLYLTQSTIVAPIGSKIKFTQLED